MKSILDFKSRKSKGAKISMVSAYTHWEARFLAASPVDCVMVGDTLAVLLDGESTTFSATPEIMARHTMAVAKGLDGKKLLIADFPFMAVRRGLINAVDCAMLLMRAGAHGVKIEGVDGHREIIAHLVQSGIPVLGHLGLTPQSIHATGGYKVQGKSETSAADILRQAKDLETAGAFGIVLECMPTDLARQITQSVSIPTIGIGAGPDTDGQVLVFHDMLGLNPGFKAKFVRKFAEGEATVSGGLAAFANSVADGSFPNVSESY